MNRTNYHIVKPSPWPLMASMSACAAAIGFVAWNHHYNYGSWTLILSLISISTVFALWCRDTLRESLYLGMHTILTKSGAGLGFAVFMVSETFFFAAFIWSYFYTALTLPIHIGVLWPPLGINKINPWTLPLLNTLILLSSGASITWTHNVVLGEHRKHAIQGFVWTIGLGCIFSLIQIVEYHFAPFTISDSTFGTVFYTTLTLHAIHIWIGCIWLTLCALRLFHYKINSVYHQIFEGALLFWHLIDGIWIILFLFFYVWVV